MTAQEERARATLAVEKALGRLDQLRRAQDKAARVAAEQGDTDKRSLEILRGLEALTAPDFVDAAIAVARAVRADAREQLFRAGTP